MADSLVEQESPEKRVFGEAFSLSDGGRADEEIVLRFFRTRISEIKDGKTTWLPRTLDGERGVAADLIKGGAVVALLDVDYDYHLSTVYTTSENGQFGDTTLCEGVKFEDAVAQAELFAASL